MALAFVAPSLAATEIATLVASATGLDTTNDTTIIYQAITEAGHMASIWNRRGWWWSRGYNNFPTVSTTKSYALRTVNTAAMTEMYAPLAMWYSTNRRLTLIDKVQYDEWNSLLSSTGSPEWYALEGDLTAHIWPTPDAAYTIYVSYIERHSKITASTGLLTVPEEFHYGVYVNGAIDLLQGDHLGDPWYLRHSKRFRDCMAVMAAADAQKWDSNSDLSGQDISWPPDTKVFTSKHGLTV